MKKLYIILVLFLGFYTAQSQRLQSAEYFFGSDPGVGNATALSITVGDTLNEVFSVPISSLSEGFNNLNVRLKDSIGVWSFTLTKIFYKMPIIALAASTPRIERIEYYVDSDPGQGNATPIDFTSMGDTTYQVFSIPVASLSDGFHNLNVRVQDSLGNWSFTLSKIFYKMPIMASSASTPRVERIEYFVDSDPGQGNATPIDFTSMGDTTYQVFSIPVASLSTGFHNLSVRVQDSLGDWSFTLSKIFYKMDTKVSTTAAKIVAMEYFYDIDPGVGNGLPLSINQGDTVNQILSTSISGLDSGYHFICVRAVDSIGSWSQVMTDTFKILGCSSPASDFTTATSFCIGDTISLSNTTTGTDQWISYLWDMDNDGIDEFSALGDTSYVFNTEGVYQIKLTATNSSAFSFGCVDTTIKTISVHALPQTNITVYGSGTICPGSSISIGTYPGLGYAYKWLKNDTIIPNATSVLYSANTNGNYSVEVTSFYGCIDTSVVSSVNMYSMPPASISLSGANSFCYGDSVELTAIGGTNLSYLWYKNGVAQMNDTLQSITVNNPGSFKVQISSVDGCLDESLPEIVTVNPLPIVNLFSMGNTVFCDGDSVTLQTNTNTGYSYIWYKDGNIQAGDTLYELTAHNSGNFSVKIKNEFNCAATSATASVISNPIPISSFNLINTTCSQDTVSITYTGSASIAAFLSWDLDGGILLNGSGQGPFEVKWDSAGYKDVSLIISDNNCISNTVTNTVEVKSISANISSANYSVCLGDSVMLYANTGNNYTYQWYQGGLLIPTANTSSLSAMQTGNYQVRITDANIGCSQISSAKAVAINPTDFALAFTVNNTTFTQPPFDVNFTNQTPNMSNYQFDWDLGDGNTSNFYNPGHSYQYNGNYTVNLYAEDASTGCRDTLTKVDYINCSGGAPNPCTILAAISPAGPITICGNDSLMLTANAGTGYTYQWVYNNMLMPNKDSIVLYAKNSGNYRVVVSDAICSQTSPAFVLNHYPSIQPIIQATGSIQPCTTDSLNLSLLVGYNSYNWNNGSTAASIYVNQTGYYQVDVTDNYGCNMTSTPYVVSNSFLSPPELCIVGVDTANHNQLVWERQSSALIDSFYVYRESYIAGQYDKIGAIPFTQTSLFVDANSNPAVKAYKYKIAAVDTCGGVTLLGNYHKTIHLTINAGLNGSWNLIWDGYEGFAFNSYRIYRGTNSTNMNLLTQLASTANSYTDLNPPIGTVFYQIEAIKTTGCYPDTVQAKANTNYNTSRSNTANNANITPVFLTADFDGDVQTGVWPVQINFNDLSTGSPTTWHWDFGDGNSSVEQSPAHMYNNTGLYTVRLIACNGTICDTTVKTDYIEVLPNGIVEVGVDISTQLYPNPNDGNFTLEINDKGNHELQVHIYNTLGAEVYSEKFQSNGNTHKNLKLSHLANGVYYVHLNTKNKIVYRSKVVIQK